MSLRPVLGAFDGGFDLDAAALPERHRTAWIAGSCILQGLIAVLFFTWRAAF